jgi:signal peptidase I
MHCGIATALSELYFLIPVLFRQVKSRFSTLFQGFFMNRKLRTINQTLSKTWQENKSFIVFIVLMGLFRSAFADWNTVPTGSMLPTIVEGDRIAVNKLAYDLRIPFTHISLVKLGDPERGDIVVFDSKAADNRLVKRVIGLPGDTVSMVNNRLTINGVEVDYENIDAVGDGLEHLPGVNHKVRISYLGNYSFASFPAVTIPQGHYLMLGDNRDKSADSRVIGFVPRDEIIGRSRSVVMSFNYGNYYLPRLDRFFKEL